jgi:hypothetical protein
MVKIKSPPTIKEIEGKFGVSFKGIVIGGKKTEVLDADKVIIELKKKERALLIDANDKFYEIYRDKKGYYQIRKILKEPLEFQW